MHDGAILGCETHSINRCSEMETLSEFNGQNGKTRQFSSQTYCFVLNEYMLSHKVNEHSEKPEMMQIVGELPPEIRVEENTPCFIKN